MINSLSEYFNSLHFWLCAQPIDFDPKAVPNQKLTPAQDEQLAELAYFGWRSQSTGFRTLDWNLPRLELTATAITFAPTRNKEKPKPQAARILASTMTSGA